MSYIFKILATKGGWEVVKKERVALRENHYVVIIIGGGVFLL